MKNLDSVSNKDSYQLKNFNFQLNILLKIKGFYRG